MRNLVLSCAALFAISGCNDDNLLGGMDMVFVPDMAGVDLAVKMPNGVTCGSDTCMSPEVCCLTPSGMTVSTMCAASGSCGNMSGELACDGPEDCVSASAGNCCATAKFSLGAGDMGPMPEGADAVCGSDSDCAAGVDLNAGELHTKLCHKESDCTGYTGDTPLGSADFNGCCTSDQAPGVSFCAPKQFMTIQGRRLYTCL
jgi:hypothetical protein